MGAEQFVHESSLFENRERSLPAGTQEAGYPLRCVLAARNVRHTLDTQFRSATMAAKWADDMQAANRAAPRRREVTARFRSAFALLSFMRNCEPFRLTESPAARPE